MKSTYAVSKLNLAARWVASCFALAGLASGALAAPLADRVMLHGVPFVAQLPNFCGPAALSEVLSFWGHRTSQKSIADRVYDRRRGATSGADLLLFAREEGLSAFTSLSTIDTLRRELRAGLPVVVLQDLSREDRRGHFRVVVGFSDLSRTFYVRDSNYPDICRIPYAEFEEIWRSFDNWSLVVCPPERSPLVPLEVRENPVLHIDLGQAYLHRRRHDLARENFLASLRLEPGNEEAQALLASLDRSRHPS